MFDGKQYSDVSIHAPVKGATRFKASMALYLDVSIHAPVKGATSKQDTYSIRAQCFNPRAREGRDF